MPTHAAQPPQLSGVVVKRWVGGCHNSTIKAKSLAVKQMNAANLEKRIWSRNALPTIKKSFQMTYTKLALRDISVCTCIPCWTVIPIEMIKNSQFLKFQDKSQYKGRQEKKKFKSRKAANLLSGPISLQCLKLANSIFMPQACYFPLPSFYFWISSLIAMGYPKRRKEEEGKAFYVSSPAWKRLKSLEGCRKNLCEHNKQQQPRKLNPKEKSASWEPLCNRRGSIST